MLFRVFRRKKQRMAVFRRQKEKIERFIPGLKTECHTHFV